MNQTYQLKHPFEFEGQMISEVKVKRLKGKDLVAADNEVHAVRKQRGLPPISEMPAGNSESGLFHIARATSLPIEAVEEMDMVDINSIAEGFLS